MLIASQNTGKVAEFQTLLAELPIAIVTPDKVGLESFDVAETGQTFADNAQLKAEAFAAESQLPTVADDSGLEVTAFDGFPGVKSARWHPGSDDDRNQALLERMAEVEDRSAQFVTVLCWHHPDQDQTEFFRGVVTGRIATQPAGDDGFGYDPVFIPDGYDQTFAQLGVETKNKLSHRRQAVKQLKVYLPICN